MQSVAAEVPVILRGELVELQDRLAESERRQAEHEQALKEQEQHIQQLLDYITLLKRKRFGPGADRIPAAQLKLFDETELKALIGELEEEAAPPTPPPEQRPAPEKPTARPVRKPLPEHLPRVERVIELPASEKQAMGADWTFIGYDESEQLAVIPRQPSVILFKRAKYVPVNEDVPGAEQGVVIAPRAPQILPKAIAHSSVLADVVASKFVDALPLYRQEKIFAREGIDIPRQTMAGWMIQLDERLNPLMAAMKSVLYQGRVIPIDETRLQVLNEPGRAAGQQSFMWVYRGGPSERPIVWLQYAKTCSGAVPRQFLFPGGQWPADSDPPPTGMYILTDGYSGYSALAREAGVCGHAACWAHVRRRFVEAAEGQEHRRRPSDGGADRQALRCRAPTARRLPGRTPGRARCIASPSWIRSRLGSMTR